MTGINKTWVGNSENVPIELANVDSINTIKTEWGVSSTYLKQDVGGVYTDNGTDRSALLANAMENTFVFTPSTDVLNGINGIAKRVKLSFTFETSESVSGQQVATNTLTDMDINATIFGITRSIEVRNNTSAGYTPFVRNIIFNIPEDIRTNEYIILPDVTISFSNFVLKDPDKPYLTYYKYLTAGITYYYKMTLYADVYN